MGSISEILDDDPTIAVVGATDNLGKYGARIYRNLKAKGYRVFPMNLVSETVDGDPAYADLADLPVVPDIVNIVVPPPRTREVVERCVDLGIDHVWIQPGAGDAGVFAYLDEHAVDYLANDCIMVYARRRIVA